MCGIVGFYDETVNGPEARAICARMAGLLRHRGPDAEGFWTSPEGHLQLGHRRLAIIDLSPTGAQPMVSSDGNGTLIFNGEIYNYRELRADLAARGIVFAGKSDTEVLLNALLHLGPIETLKRINGMFAFAYWNGRANELILARDRLGEKPLYYAWEQGRFLFGSEIKCLRGHPKFSAEVKLSAVASFLQLRYIPAPETIYDRTYKLPPGHLMVFRPGSRAPEAPRLYWSLSEAVVRASGVARVQVPAQEHIKEAERRLRRSVKLRMISDRPLGCFLSGGTDSTLVAALMQAESTKPIRTFTIGYREQEFDEASDAERVARLLGTEHTTFVVTSEDAFRTIGRLGEIYDEPFGDPSQIPTVMLAALASKHVTVALTGDGGDEVFGGYNRYVWTQGTWPILRRIPRSVREILSGRLDRLDSGGWTTASSLLGRIVPAGMRLRNISDKAGKVAQAIKARDGLELYRGFISSWTDAHTLCGIERKIAFPFERLELPLCIGQLEEWMMYWDSLTYLPDDILVKLDRATMAASLEGRVPFLDNEVISHAWSMPMELKIHRGIGKIAIREILGRHLPASLFNRPKTGFGIPIGAWLRGPLREWAESLLKEQRLRALIDMRSIDEAWNLHCQGRVDAEQRLWPILALAGWLSGGSV